MYRIMKNVRVVLIGLAFVGMGLLTSCEADENEVFELDAIDKKDVEDPDNRGRG